MRHKGLKVAGLLAALTLAGAALAPKAYAGDCFIQCKNGQQSVCCALKGHVTCVARGTAC